MAKESDRTGTFGCTCDLSKTEGKRRERRVATLYGGSWDRATQQDTDDEDFAPKLSNNQRKRIARDLSRARANEVANKGKCKYGNNIGVRVKENEFDDS